MAVLNHLYPASLWTYFEEICKIPRTSKNEQHIQRYLLDFAKANNLAVKQDKIGNILITRTASKGYEHCKPIILQSHMDMVGQKTSNSQHDWLNDPVIPYINNGWVMARETTLGADDGIGVAAQLTVLTDPSIHAGIIEALFTIDEETGLTGATHVEPDLFKGKTLLNLDSEDEGILFIGCAGGIDTLASLKYQPEKPKANTRAVEISITGLHGGHSGDEIHKGYGNAIIILGQLLLQLSKLFNITISHFNGGSLRNAIPRDAHATFTIDKSLYQEAKRCIAEYKNAIENEYKNVEHDMVIAVNDTDTPLSVFDFQTQLQLLTAITDCPNGVIAWSKEIAGIVETSSNLAIIKTNDDNTIYISSSQRSSDEESKKRVSRSVTACFNNAGATVTHSDGYPAWQPNINSRILKITRDSYKKLFNCEPVVTVIHAGLECGLFCKKIENIDMISFGPTVKGAHTTEEALEINSVAKFWDLLVDVIRCFK